MPAATPFAISISLIAMPLALPWSSLALAVELATTPLVLAVEPGFVQLYLAVELAATPLYLAVELAAMLTRAAKATNDDHEPTNGQKVVWGGRKSLDSMEEEEASSTDRDRDRLCLSVCLSPHEYAPHTLLKRPV